MRPWIGVVVASLIAPGWVLGQLPLDPGRVPEALQLLDGWSAGPGLQCDIHPSAPRLNYDFRFQSGYALEVPLKQYQGSGNAFQVFIRVAPVEPAGPAVFLEQSTELPSVPKKNRSEFQLAGGYYLGDGKYSVDLAIGDQAGRSCRKHWRVETRRSGAELSVPLALAPGTVAPFTFETWKSSRSSVAGRPLRVSVFLHAIPLSRRVTSLRLSDQEVLLGSLASLRAQIPGAQLKVVAFNLDQQAEIFRDPAFEESGWDNLLEALEKQQLGTVSYQVLRQREGHVEFLNKLIGDELDATEQADAVIFLGPTARQVGKPALLTARAVGPQFFYFEYKPNWYRNGDFPDVVYHAIRALSGKTFRIRSPTDFASAVQALRAALDLAQPSVASRDAGSSTAPRP
jgi:hypothetical protein